MIRLYSLLGVCHNGVGLPKTNVGSKLCGNVGILPFVCVQFDPLVFVLSIPVLDGRLPSLLCHA